MANKRVPVPRVIPFQPPLPFNPPPQRAEPEAHFWPPSRLAQMNRAASKLYRLVLANPYAAGLAEHHFDRLLPGEGSSPAHQCAQAALTLSRSVDALLQGGEAA